MKQLRLSLRRRAPLNLDVRLILQSLKDKHRMDIAVPHPSFVQQQLAVRTSRLWGSNLLLNGDVVKRVWGKYHVKGDGGDDVEVRLRSNLIDSIPLVDIGGDIVRLAPAMQWYEYAWLGLPVVLVISGGFLGGAIGGIAALINGRIFRSERSTIAKYGLSGVVSICAAVTFFAIAVAIASILKRR